MIEIIGWIGSICLAACAAPQAWLAYRQGHSQGLSGGTIWLWTVGEVLTLAYAHDRAPVALLFNYAANLALLCVIIRYKLFPRQLSRKNEV